jgi:hypothetical protein
MNQLNDEISIFWTILKSLKKQQQQKKNPTEQLP